MERIGIAISRPRGPTRRQAEYGIYVILEAYGIKIDSPTLYAKYEGYREGDKQVGLPGAGPNASHLQPLVEFYPHSRDLVPGPNPHSVPTWETVRFFKDGPWNKR
jgi:hypothetical protein